jgi:hypothetical protein
MEVGSHGEQMQGYFVSALPVCATSMLDRCFSVTPQIRVLDIVNTYVLYVQLAVQSIPSTERARLILSVNRTWTTMDV